MPQLVKCPQCDKQLRVPDHLLGRSVKCPACGVAFLAQAEVAGETPPDEGPPKPPRKRRADDEAVEERPRRRERIEDDEDDRPPSRRRRDEDDESEGELRPRREGHRQRAKRAVMAPAIALLIVGILGLLMSVLYVVTALVGGGDPQLKGEPGYKAGQCAVAIAAPIWGLVVTMAGFMLMNLRSRGSVMTGAIFSMLPCNPCCLAGIPVGIWALVVMSKTEVKEAFQ